MPRRIAIVGGGVSGLGVAWALHHRPDLFDFQLFEAQSQIGGNAITADMPQEDGGSIPFDISVTACIPSLYHHILLLTQQYGIDLLRTRFSYSVKYHDQIYAHDMDSEIARALQPEIDRFQKLLKRLQWFAQLNKTRSKLLNALNPFNYISMGAVLNFGRYSGDFRYKVLKPMFVNFLMATNVFDMPASLFCRYLEFFDIVAATPMQTWEGGTRRIYEELSAGFRDRIHLDRPIRKVHRLADHVIVEDAQGNRETFDDVVFACNANQTLATRSNHIAQYGARPDNYEITYIMHNQQPWAHGSDKPCLVTYNPISPIDKDKVVKTWWFQHVVHDVRHVALLVHLFRFVQGRRRTWHCGAHTLINSQEHCFLSGLATARQMGADYPFQDAEARKWFNFFGRLMYGWRFKKA